MDIQSRKLSLIEYLIQIQDETLLDRIEDLMNNVAKNNPASFKPFSKEDLIDRANEANADYKNGRITTQDQLKKDSENW